MDEMLKIFKAMSDKNRLLVLAALCKCDQLCACQIIELLGVTGATASRHMEVLINSKLVKSEKKGRWVHYHLNEEGGCPILLLNWLKSKFQDDSTIQELLERLEEITACEPQDLTRRQRAMREAGT